MPEMLFIGEFGCVKSHQQNEKALQVNDLQGFFPCGARLILQPGRAGARAAGYARHLAKGHTQFR